MASNMSKRIAALEARTTKVDLEARANLLARAIKWLAIEPPARPQLPPEISGAVDQLLRECPAMANGF